MHKQNARSVSSLVRGMVLAQAFMCVKKSGFTLRVNKIDGIAVQPAPSEQNGDRINVNVFDGVVKSSWVG